jgi:ElaB/YqjD/DUF883 family membrane-anchored ribosome-binding protein
MDKDAGKGGTAVSGTQDPEQIQHEIEETREQLGETVEALAAKTNVKAQARQKVKDAKTSVSEKQEQLRRSVGDATPEQATGIAIQASQKARENPIPVAAAGVFAAGFLAGWLIKRR